eukprot:TRINITY_DN7836_c1_g1_i1.p1 TRINITY_DN7836_c1_g1~~TRINITY_DN7836_c1_g1_i1.p1  ORF type:complete len:558 (+),score=145.91 TRINITY_DN7836_c1_g1_i1:91-1764(+)
MNADYTIEIKEEECPLKKVTVFTDRAESFRSYESEIKKGVTRFSLGFLPISVDPTSVRVIGVSGSVGILEVSAQHSSKLVRVDKAELVKEVKESTEALQKQYDEALLDHSIIESEKSWIQEYSKSMTSVPVEKVSNFLTFYTEKLKSINERLSKSTKNRDSLLAQLTKCKQDILTESRKAFTQAEFCLEAKEDSKVSLILSYSYVKNNYWRASYDIRVQSETQKIEFVYYGIIDNPSSENWSQVDLTLSTSRPGARGAPPSLYTKHVRRESKYGRHHPYVLPTPIVNMGQTNAAIYNPALNQVLMGYPQQQAIAAPAPLPASSVPNIIPGVEVEENAYSCNFVIPRKCTIPSDGKPHRVTVGTAVFDAKFNYETIPKLQTQAFLKASVSNETSWPFLKGPMNIFMDGDYVSQSEMKYVSPNENFTIFLGADEGVKVEYKNLGSNKSTTKERERGERNKTTTTEIVVKSRITITNYKKIPITLAIYDQLPLSSEDDIKVKLVRPELTERGGPKENSVKLTESNNVRWYATLEAGKSKDFPFEYLITGYRNAQLDMSSI